MTEPTFRVELRLICCENDLDKPAPRLTGFGCAFKPVSTRLGQSIHVYSTHVERVVSNTSLLFRIFTVVVIGFPTVGSFSMTNIDFSLLPLYFESNFSPPHVSTSTDISYLCKLIFDSTRPAACLCFRLIFFLRLGPTCFTLRTGKKGRQVQVGRQLEK